MSDYYNTLGISKSASADEIKKAYRRLALKYHPDRGGDHNKFTEINEAYQVLSDPQKRASYDQFGKAGSAFGGGGNRSQGFGGQTGGFSGFDFGSQSEQGFEFNFGGGGLGDIFGDLFSQAFSTVQAEIQISLAQAVLGDHLSVEISGEKIDLEIPAGVHDGTQFRVRGKGRKTRNGQSGDLILQINIKMPSRLSKEQRELWEKLKDLDTQKKSWWNR